MTRARTAAVIFGALVLHVTLFVYVRPFGVAPDVLVLIAVIGATMGGGDYGARNGFFAGLAFDLVAAGPFGLAAGVYGALGYGAGLLAQTVDSQDPRVLPATAGVGSFIGVLGYGLGLGVLGIEQYVEWRLLWVALGVGLYNVFLAFPAQLAYRWVSAGDRNSARAESSRTMVN
ncbi:MAG: hypothetical protein ACR2P0_00175 [Acidimicrobiales bacterium]